MNNSKRISLYLIVLLVTFITVLIMYNVINYQIENYVNYNFLDIPSKIISKLEYSLKVNDEILLQNLIETPLNFGITTVLLTENNIVKKTTDMNFFEKKISEDLILSKEYIFKKENINLENKDYKIWFLIDNYKIQKLWKKVLFILGMIFFSMLVGGIIVVEIICKISKSGLNQLKFILENNEYKKNNYENQEIIYMIKSLKEQNEILKSQILKKEEVEKDLLISKEIQKLVLNRKKIPIPGLDYEIKFRPAKEISGDLFDVIKISETRYILIQGDVSGKGVTGALIMTSFLTYFRNIIHNFNNIKEVILELNNFVVTEFQNFFITLFICEYNTIEEKLSFIRAGHNPLYNINSELMKYIPKGVPLGFFENKYFQKNIIMHTIKIKKNDKFIIFSDGLTDVRNKNNQIYGMKKIENFIKNIKFEEPKQIADEIMNEIIDYSGNNDFYDDIVLLVIRKK